jgi:hypothetical protein
MITGYRIKVMNRRKAMATRMNKASNNRSALFLPLPYFPLFILKIMTQTYCAMPAAF